jgi:hypothetical protein
MGFDDPQLMTSSLRETASVREAVSTFRNVFDGCAGVRSTVQVKRHGD